MASTFHAVLGALVALAFWTALGYPICRRLLPVGLALPFAPIAGWAMHGVLAVPIFFLVPFRTVNVALVALVALAVAWSFSQWPRNADGAAARVRVPIAAWIAAALLAVVVAAAIAPKHVGDAIQLSDQIYDHAKVAIVADIARTGMPPANPFLAETGGAGRLSYYYLWHFTAAELVRVTGIGAWDAAIAMTFFSAFTSLAAMMGLATVFAGRASAALWVVALAASASSRVLLLSLFGASGVDRWVSMPGGFGGWLFQSPWVPQHVASTSCVLLAVSLMTVVARRPRALAAVVLGLAMAAAFESSTWIGGVVFGIACVVVVPWTILRVGPAKRWPVVAWLALSGIVTVALAWPFITDQFAASAARQSASPIALSPFEVLGDAVPASVATVLDKPAFWLLLLPIELTAIYLPGLIVIVRSMRARAHPLAPSSAADDRRPLAAVAVVALLASWLLRSTLADNNDLAWRAVLLASTLLIVFAGVGIASWVADRRWLGVALAVVAIAVGLPETVLQVQRNVVGHPRAAGKDFAESVDEWAEVRRRTPSEERVANNPLDLSTMTPWPVNIGWALLADRRSCYAGWELTQVYSSVPHDALRATDALFVRVFDGSGTPEDVQALATRYECSVAVVTARDGAWTRDPFRDSDFYVRVEERPDRWRIYRRR